MTGPVIENVDIENVDFVGLCDGVLLNTPICLFDK